MKFTKKFFCPVNGWDCSYWKEDGSCSMVDDGDDPVMECDDAAAFWEPNEDYFVWETFDGERLDRMELLERGYTFSNGEPYYDPTTASTQKIVAEILKSPPIGMKKIEIKNPKES